MKKNVIVTKTIIHIVFLFIISIGSTSWAAKPIKVFVSIMPQKYFVQKIGKDLVTVDVMVQPGASPATYEPRPGQMKALSRARAYFAIGVPFEKAWLKKIAASNPDMMVVHTDHGIQKVPMAVQHHRRRGYRREIEQGHDGRREQGILDPHIWTSPPLVLKQAGVILAALENIDPEHGAAYEDNYKTFESEIMKLDAEFRNSLAGRRGLQFMVFHPAWGYFARTYGLKQVPIEIEGKDPKPAQLKGLIDQARADNIRVIFVQPQFSSKSAGLIAKAIGGQVAFVDPLALNWPENLREAAGKFKAALR
ncbi:MAG: zinc ABC transporter substrate-binding protein [Deltaproteobacteria bacterium]|nr:zinc ABC transporter substrate-binding protein [Deltaproteobacteria bacterium]